MSSSDNKPLPPPPISTPASPSTSTTTSSKKSSPDLGSPKRSKSPNKSRNTSSPNKTKANSGLGVKENLVDSNSKDKEKEKEKVGGAESPKKSQNHNRKGSSRSQSGKNTNAAASNKSATSTAPVQASEGLSNLKNIISELKDTSSGSPPPPSTTSTSNPRSNKGHKSTGSASTSASSVPAAPNVVVSQAPASSTSPHTSTSSISSNLNPNAGGFQPGTLGIISDLMDESLITPTASSFDLMTGLPSTSTRIGGGGKGLGGGSFAFPPTSPVLIQQQQSQQQQQLAQQQSLAQQQQFLQLQAQQQHFQLQQLALLGYGPGSNPTSNLLPTNMNGVGTTPGELMMAEQMAIQQQLEALRLQQASLLTRFSEMQVASATAAAQSQQLQSIQSQGLGQVVEDSSSPPFNSNSNPTPGRNQSTSGPSSTSVSGQHRRIHSQQDRQGGQMGSFGSFGGSSNHSAGGGGGSGSGFNNLTTGGNGSQGGLGYSTSNSLPKGHGRRHSVNTLNKSTNGHQSTPSNGGGGQNQNGNNGGGIFGPPMVNHSNLNLGSPAAAGLRNSFTFPTTRQQDSNNNNYNNNNNNNNNNSNGNGNNNSNSSNGHRSVQSQDLDFGSSSYGGVGGSGHTRRQSGSVSSFGGWSMNTNINSSNSPSANLAEAQSHLQQLTTYRASAGHSRVPSFGMSLPGGGPGQLSMSGYGGGITPSNQHQNSSNNNGGGGGNNQMRKSLFAPYLPQASIPPLLAAGKLVVGILRVNKRNRSDAYVTADGLDSDIYVCGSKDRNRALEGDLVAIELLDVDEVWGTKKDKEEKKRKKEETSIPSTSTPFDPRASISTLRKLDKKKDEVEVEGQGLLLLEEEEVTDDQKPSYAGHVVAVVERAPGQLFSGMLGVLRPSSAATQQKQDAERRERDGGGGGGEGRSHGYHTPQQTPKIIWFRPTDKRVPLIAIPTDQAPHDFIDRPENYADRLFVACIKRWPISSLHPFGTLVEELGVIGDIETETSALLKDCNFSAEDFSESVLKCLPPSPYVITEQELQVRKDYRDNRVFTIDPETAKDLDDALHVVKNEDGTFEVGVHIADVTHYVKPNTALDREARKRATTVYLVQRAVPMLPPALSETLCSLTAGEDKLTFSTVFTMSPQGRVLSTWFGKTIINSKVKLAYSDAQDVIDGKGLRAGKVVDKNEVEGIEKDILMLAQLARQMRARRFDTGALRIDNVKVSFGLDEDGLPVDCLAFERKEANELIEEFMLLANLTVAGKIAAGLPEQALLRRHEPPIDRRLDAFVERMGKLNINLDASSSGALMKSFEKVTDKDERITLQHLSTKSMQRAKYFCTGMLDISKYSHYALNLPLYTHFTSPIRRYADVMVHRQLEAVLASGSIFTDSKFTLDTEAVAKVAQICNTKKDAAKLAQEQSAHLFLCVLISQLTHQFGPVIRNATVIGVLDAAFDVLVPEFGVEKRCRVDSIPIDNHVYEPVSNTLKLFWKKGIDVLSWTAETQNDSHLQQVRAYADHHAALLLATTSKPHSAEGALFEDDSDLDSDESELEEGEIREGVKARNSSQYKKSKDKTELVFEEVEQSGKFSTQVIRELATVPVILTADMTKSPPVIKIICINPFK